MPPTEARSGFGTLFQRGDGATPTETFATVAEVRNISGPNITRDTDDATHMESTNGWREYISTLRDGGEVTLELNLAPSSTNAGNLFADLSDDTARNYRLAFPATGGGTAKRFSFAAFQTAASPTSPHDGRMAMSATFKITGEPIFEDVS